MRYIITVTVENRAGALAKISGLFARRGFNIESLAVGVTEDVRISRMTVIVDCDAQTIQQMEKQLNKLIDTIKVKVLLSDACVCRELTLARVSCAANRRAELFKTVELMDARVADVTPTTITVELSDTSERTDTLIALLKPFGIRELVRTGVSAIEKGTK